MVGEHAKYYEEDGSALGDSFHVVLFWLFLHPDSWFGIAFTFKALPTEELLGDSFPFHKSPLFGPSDFSANLWICAAIVRCFGGFIYTLQLYTVQSLAFAFFQTYIAQWILSIFRRRPRSDFVTRAIVFCASKAMISISNTNKGILNGKPPLGLRENDSRYLETFSQRWRTGRWTHGKFKKAIYRSRGEPHTIFEPEESGIVFMKSLAILGSICTCTDEQPCLS